MAIRNIVKHGDDVLTKKCRTVEVFDQRLCDLVDDLFDTLYDSGGAGLAAPQVGVLRRIAVVDIGDGPYELINPEIIETEGEQYGAEAISMAKTLRRIMQINKDEKKYLIGFIADQVPTWESINHWLDFFHRETPVFTGTEKIACRTHAALFYARMERVKRGYYVIHIEPFAQDAALLPEFEATNTYYRLLTENIRQTPELWLWTHKRWKRTREGYARREAKRIEDRRKLAEKARNNV